MGFLELTLNHKTPPNLTSKKEAPIKQALNTDIEWQSNDALHALQ